jgi:hypothetical protein
MIFACVYFILSILAPPAFGLEKLGLFLIIGAVI